MCVIIYLGDYVKRENYISWDEYFMGVALLSCERSKDPNTQVGACIVNKQNRIVSLGYNGLPNNVDDSICPWDKREGTLEDTKYAYVAHAELNAILNSKTNMEDTVLYVTLFPCNECAKAIIQAGIKEIVYLSDKYNGTESNKVAKKMLSLAGVKYREYNNSGKNITLNL